MANGSQMMKNSIYVVPSERAALGVVRVGRTRRPARCVSVGTGAQGAGKRATAVAKHARSRRALRCHRKVEPSSSVSMGCELSTTMPAGPTAVARIITLSLLCRPASIGGGDGRRWPGTAERQRAAACA